MVRAWSVAHNDWDIKELDRLYAPKVLFFCQEISRKECINKFASLLKPSDPYEHRIVSEITATEFQNGLIKCDFSKEVVSRAGTTTTSSYLVLKREGGNYSIVAEGETEADKKMNSRLEIGESIEVKEILPTAKGSSAVKQKEITPFTALRARASHS